MLAACGDDGGGPLHDAGSDAATAIPDFHGGVVTVTTLNVLHGLFCPDDTGACRLADRIELLGQHVDAACPDVITLQEIWNASAPLVESRLGRDCGFGYQTARSSTLVGVDDEMVLSRYPILDAHTESLHRDFRHVLHVLVDHPLGAVDVYTTHLASSSDGATDPCATSGDACPAACVEAGASTVRECQGVELARLVERTRVPDGVALVTGDLNAEPSGFVHAALTGTGLVDAWLAADLAECDAATGVGCTSGRADEDLTALESPELGQNERVDYVFVGAPATASCTVGATALFAGEPNPFGACGPLPLPPCWPSDHSGVATAADCR